MATKDETESSEDIPIEKGALVVNIHHTYTPVFSESLSDVWGTNIKAGEIGILLGVIKQDTFGNIPYKVYYFKHRYIGVCYRDNIKPVEKKENV